MEICSISGQFPAYSLRLRLEVLPTASSFGRAQSSLIFCSTLPPTNLCYETDRVEPEFSNRMFILGMGFVGEFFVKDLNNRGWDGTGTCTSIAKKTKLEEMGFNVHVFDANEPEPEVLKMMKNHTHIVVSIPPVVGIGDPMIKHEQLTDSKINRISVYGDCGDAWVDEQLGAEEGWLTLGRDLKLSSQVFRLGGIYGPGRSAIDTIMKEEPLSKNRLMKEELGVRLIHPRSGDWTAEYYQFDIMNMDG